MDSDHTQLSKQHYKLIKEKYDLYTKNNLHQDQLEIKEKRIEQLKSENTKLTEKLNNSLKDKDGVN